MPDDIESSQIPAGWRTVPAIRQKASCGWRSEMTPPWTSGAAAAAAAAGPRPATQSRGVPSRRE